MNVSDSCTLCTVADSWLLQESCVSGAAAGSEAEVKSEVKCDILLCLSDSELECFLIKR